MERARPINRLSPVEPDRRTRRLASGALRPATENGVSQISAPIRGWTTEQMLEDMRRDDW